MTEEKIVEERKPRQSIMPIAGVMPRRTYIYREQTDSIKSLLRALSVAQGEMVNPLKGTQGQYGKFADLSDIRRVSKTPMAMIGLSITQTYAVVDTELYLVTTLGHESGEWLSSIIPIRQAALDAQKTLGYMTYMRRAAYAAILGLASDDDDDGVSANDCAAHAALDAQTSAFSRASKALNGAKTAVQIDKILTLAKQKTIEGTMHADAVPRLEAMAKEILVTILRDHEHEGDHE